MPCPSPRHPGRRALPSLLAAGVAIVVGSAWSQSLSERSPFLPPDFNQPSATEDTPAAQPASVQHLRLKGVFALNGKVKVNLFNTQTNKGTWVAVSDEIEGHRVVSYDAEERAVDLDVDGKITRFEMISPTDSPLPVATAPRTTVASRATARTPTTGGNTSVRRRTIVPPRPTARRTTTNTGQRTNRRTVVRPSPRPTNPRPPRQAP